MTTAIVISLISLAISIITAAWKLAARITENTEAVKNLTSRLDEFKTDNEKDHTAMWDKIETAESNISDHETRLQLLEHKGA